jgi:hypothetical protein
MKKYLCLLQNGAKRRIDNKILGIASSYSSAIHICVQGVFTMASEPGKIYEDMITHYRSYQTWWDKPKFDEVCSKMNSQSFKDEVLKQTEAFYENLKDDDIKLVNQLMLPQFKKMGSAKRWCEIIEIETDTLVVK